MTINNILNANVYKDVLAYNENSLRNQVKSLLKDILTEASKRGDKEIEIGMGKLGSYRKLEIAQDILKENGWKVEMYDSNYYGAYLTAALE